MVGCLERGQPIPIDLPDRSATTFITSHFRLDDYIQSSEDPTPLQAIPEDDASGYQTPYEAEQERLDRIYRGYGGDRFDPPDLAGDPQADALSGSGQQPPGAAGLAAVQAFRSQLPQEAADYFRQNVMPRPGPQPQPPPQIIGRPSDVERLLDEAGQRAQEVERGAAQAIEETEAVAAEEGEAAAAAEGVGGAFGYLGSLAEGAAALAPTAGEVGATLAGAAGVGAAGAAGLAVGLAGGAAYGLVKGTEWVLDNTIFRPQQGGGDQAVQDVRSANGMNDITQAQHFSLRSGSTPSHSIVSNSDPGFQAQSQSSSSQPSSRASSASSFRVQAQSNHTAEALRLGHQPSDAAAEEPRKQPRQLQLSGLRTAASQLRAAGPRH